MAFYETDLNPYVGVNPDINLPVDVLQAEGKALEDAYAKALAKAEKNAEDLYVQRGVTSRTAADDWNASIPKRYADISAKLMSGQYTTRQAKDEMLKLQQEFDTQRPLYDVLTQLSSQAAFEQGRKELDAAKQSNDEAITPNWNEELGQFEDYKTLQELERSRDALGLVINPSDWSSIFRKQAMSAIAPETRELYENSTVVYKDFYNEQTNQWEKAPFLRSKDGKETRFTRDLIERDLGLNNDALFEQLFQSSKSWGVADYYEKMKGLSPEEQRAKFKEDLIQSTTGQWRADRNITVSEKRIPEGKKGKGSGGSGSDAEGKPVAAVPITIGIPGINNPETGKPFTSEEINARTVRQFDNGLRNKVIAEAQIAWAAIDKVLPGTTKLVWDEQAGVNRIVPTKAGESNKEVIRQAQTANKILTDIAAQTDGLIDMNQDMLREAYGSSAVDPSGHIDPLNEARNRLINPTDDNYYRTPNDLDINFASLREGSGLADFAITSNYEVGKVKEAGDIIRAKARQNPEYRKLFMGELPMSKTIVMLQDLKNETNNLGFEILEEGVVTAWASKHDPRYKLYKELSNDVIDGIDVQEVGSYLPRGAETQEQIREAVLATLAGSGKIQDGETGKYLEGDELNEVVNSLFMTSKDEAGNSRKVFQGTPEARLMFNYSNPEGTDIFAALLMPIIDGKRRKLIFDNVQGLSNLAIEGSVATRDFLEESSAFVKKAASRNWTSSEHNGVHVDFSRKAGSGDMNFYLPEAGAAFRANTDDGLMRYINDIKELAAQGYPADQVRKIALDQAPSYGVTPLDVKSDYDQYYVSKLQKRQSILENRSGATKTKASSAEGSTSSTVPEADRKALEKYEASSYDTLYGNAEKQDGQFKGKKVTEMTISEVLDFQDPNGAYGQSVKKQIGRVSTPVGKYQFVGTTLRTVVQEMGLDLNEKFTPEMQDKIYNYHIRKVLGRGRTIPQKRQALKNEWEGFKKASDKELDEIIANYS